jgi:hypothetical protein
VDRSPNQFTETDNSNNSNSFFDKGRKAMENSGSGIKQLANRRSFLKKGALGAGAAAVGAGLLANGSSAFGQGRDEGSPSKGDVAILQLLLAAEIIETDLWQQYRELGGVEAAANNPVVAPYIT